MRATRNLRKRRGQREQVLSDVRETVDEIHMSSLADAGVVPTADGTAPEGEEDAEELELEEAQAEAEALLDAEARGTGTVDARAEVRAPAGTAGYTQRAPRPRPGYDRSVAADVVEADGDSRAASRRRKSRRSAIC